MLWKKTPAEELALKVIKNLDTSPNLWSLEFDKLVNHTHQLGIVLKYSDLNDVQYIGVARDTTSDIRVAAEKECSYLIRQKLKRAIKNYRKLAANKRYLEGISLVPTREDNPEAFV